MRNLSDVVSPATPKAKGAGLKLPSITMPVIALPRTTAGKAALYGSAGLAVAITVLFAVIGPKRAAPVDAPAQVAVEQPAGPGLQVTPALAPQSVDATEPVAPQASAAAAAVTEQPALPTPDPAPVASPAPAPTPATAVVTPSPVLAPVEASKPAARPAPKPAVKPQQEQMSEADRAQLRALQEQLRAMKGQQ